MVYTSLVWTEVLYLAMYYNWLCCILQAMKIVWNTSDPSQICEDITFLSWSDLYIFPKCLPIRSNRGILSPRDTISCPKISSIIQIWVSLFTPICVHSWVNVGVIYYVYLHPICPMCCGWRMKVIGMLRRLCVYRLFTLISPQSPRRCEFSQDT